MTGAGRSARIAVRVQPGAREDAVVGAHGDAIKVRVTAPPESGRANDAVIRLLSRLLALPPSLVTVVAGATRRSKIVEIEGWSEDEARARLLAEARRATS